MTIGDGMPEGGRRPKAAHKLHDVRAIARRIRNWLHPHCERCEIAGSIRRRKPVCGDIEIVCIPKPYDVGLFASGVAKVLDEWPVIRGQLPGCKYTARWLPEGVQLDVFFARPENWGLIFAIRTGSARWVHKKLASRWARMGYVSHEGMLYRKRAIAGMPDGKTIDAFDAKEPIHICEESDLFDLLGLPWVPPERRELPR